MTAASWRPQIVVLASIWGASFLFIKVAVADLAPIDVALGRVAIGAAVLLGIAAVRRVPLPRGRGAWADLAVAAALFNAVPFSLFAYGETRISSVLAGLWNATTPLLTLLVALVVLPEERPTRRRVLGLLVGFAGVVVVLGPWRGLGGAALTGQLMCLGAACCYGLGFAHTKRRLAGRPESGLALSAAQMICATLLLGLATLVVGGAPGSLGTDTVLSMLALGGLGTGIAYILNYAIIRRAGATTAATVTYLVPLFSTVLGVVVLGEALSWNEPAGAIVVLVGVALAQGLLARRGRAGDTPASAGGTVRPRPPSRDATRRGRP